MEEYLEKQKHQDETKTNPARLSCRFNILVYLRIIITQHISGDPILAGENNCYRRLLHVHSTKYTPNVEIRQKWL